MPKVRLIDANALMEKVCGDCQRNDCVPDATDTVYGCLFSESIDQMPTIKADPVMHARWETWGYVFHGIEWRRCSRCGKCADASYYGLLDGEIRMSTPAICGGCGARMDADDINVLTKDGGAENG